MVSFVWLVRVVRCVNQFYPRKSTFPPNGLHQWGVEASCWNPVTTANSEKCGECKRKPPLPKWSNICISELPGKHSLTIYLRQLWLFRGIKLMEISSNLLSRYFSLHRNTLPETNMPPEKRPSQKETNIPTIHFRCYVSFREGKTQKHVKGRIPWPVCFAAGKISLDLRRTPQHYVKLFRESGSGNLDR